MKGVHSKLSSKQNPLRVGIISKLPNSLAKGHFKFSGEKGFEASLEARSGGVQNLELGFGDSSLGLNRVKLGHLRERAQGQVRVQGLHILLSICLPGRGSLAWHLGSVP